ncbi:MAG: NADH:flavin oxidoreductase/NADH oxidase [Syntrophothermus sp.]
MSRLFSGISIRGVEIKNRVFMSPMCQYSAVNGIPNEWHFVHLGSRAVGGTGLIITEATGVSPAGRISPDDLGLWNDEQKEAFTRITAFISSHDAVPGIQLAHAGRKASTFAPWKGSGEITPEAGGWETLSADAEAFAPGYPVPRAMTAGDIKEVTGHFAAAAARAVQAGFKVIELHMAHGYLIHQFLSPLSNHRKDEYGGSFENRIRFALQTAEAVRRVIPDNMPLFARLSCTDWVEGGWDPEQSVALSAELKKLGVDLIDCSSGGSAMHAKIEAGPGYQVEFAAKIKKETGILTGAVGFITSAVQADQIIRTGQADAVLLGRELLRNPYWPQTAAKELRSDINWPEQYLRAK